MFMSDLIGNLILKDPEIQNLVSQLATRVTELNSSFKTTHSPEPHHQEEAQSYLDQTALLRGRPLHYPYIGTGAGRGPFVELLDGSVKLDLINGIGIHILGHSHPDVLKASIFGALQDVTNQGNLQPNREYTALLEKLVTLASKKSRLKYAWLSTCGTMANESALKIARQKTTPARMILAFKNAFAGRSTLMAEVTDNPAYKVGLPEYHEVLRLSWYDKKNPHSTEQTLNELKEHIAKYKGQICSFVFEPMLGEGGYMPAPREFFIPLLDLCQKEKIPVWVDEVQTFTRTGELFAFETLDLGSYVDIVTLAKTAQVGATLYTEEFNPKPGLIAGTFSGSSTALRAGLEILNFLEKGSFFGPQGRIQSIHNYFIQGLNTLAQGSCRYKIADPAGLGLMIAFTPFEGKKEQVDLLLKKLFHKGLIAFNCGKDPVRVRFLIPAIIQDHEMDLALKIIEECLLEGVE
jgi:4-aminobutyrate aminotransferase-like enzyme